MYRKVLKVSSSRIAAILWAGILACLALTIESLKTCREGDLGFRV
jgi:hypothetical protein